MIDQKELAVTDFLTAIVPADAIVQVSHSLSDFPSNT